MQWCVEDEESTVASAYKPVLDHFRGIFLENIPVVRKACVNRSPQDCFEEKRNKCLFEFAIGTVLINVHTQHSFGTDGPIINIFL